jgi:hypothetical protein
MRFDILDEYSTVVPFGLGVSRRNRVVQYPTTSTEAVNRDAIAKSASRFKLASKFIAMLRHIGKLDKYRPIY